VVMSSGSTSLLSGQGPPAVVESKRNLSAGHGTRNLAGGLHLNAPSSIDSVLELRKD
jgi:hypothetical protein